MVRVIMDKDKRAIISFSTKNQDLLLKLEKIAQGKGRYKFNQTCIEILQLGILSYQKGYIVSNGELAQIKIVE